MPCLRLLSKRVPQRVPLCDLVPYVISALFGLSRSWPFSLCLLSSLAWMDESFIVAAVSSQLPRVGQPTQPRYRRY